MDHAKWQYIKWAGRVPGAERPEGDTPQWLASALRWAREYTSGGFDMQWQSLPLDVSFGDETIASETPFRVLLVGLAATTDDATDVLWLRGLRIPSVDFALDRRALSTADSGRPSTSRGAERVAQVSARVEKAAGTLRPSAASSSAIWDRVREQFAAVDGVRELGARGRLAETGPGAFLMRTEGDQAIAVFAGSLKDAWAYLADDTDAHGLEPSRKDALWIPGGADDVIRLAGPLMKRASSPLRQGAPLMVTSDAGWSKAPHSAGVFRVHGTTADNRPATYIGRTHDLATLKNGLGRVNAAYFPNGWSEVGGTRLVELLPTKAQSASNVWSQADLTEAARRHYASAKADEAAGGPVVLGNLPGQGRSRADQPRLMLLSAGAAADEVVPDFDEWINIGSDGLARFRYAANTNQHEAEWELPIGGTLAVVRTNWTPSDVNRGLIDAKSPGRFYHDEILASSRASADFERGDWSARYHYDPAKVYGPDVYRQYLSPDLGYQSVMDNHWTNTRHE